MYGVRQCSTFILLHVSVQCSQHHFLDWLSLNENFFLYWVSVTVQWLGLGTFTAGAWGLIPGWETKFPHAMRVAKLKKKYVSTFFFLRRNGWTASGWKFGSIAQDQFSSVAQSCLTLCDPMNRSTPGLPA